VPMSPGYIPFHPNPSKPKYRPPAGAVDAHCDDGGASAREDQGKACARDDVRGCWARRVAGDRTGVDPPPRVQWGTAMTERQLVSSGSPLEPEIGFSRAVRIGQHIAVAGTAPISRSGDVAAANNVYEQTKRCLEIIEQAIADAGGSLAHVTRTRVMLTDMNSWRDAARAHGEYFGSIRPACTFVQVVGFIHPEWLVEIEADAIVS
jgi:enamine deaminase RidA (YjgF/YER057c/UK114 family)